MLAYRPVLTDNFNVYITGVKGVSFASGLELPELNPKTETVDGAGVLGEFEEPAAGQYESTAMKLPFTHLSEEATAFLNTLEPVELMVRGAIQGVLSPGTTDVYPLRVVARAKNKGFTLGKLEKGAKSDTEIELECLYLKIEINGKTVFELDKLNFINVVNDVDVVAKIREMC